MKKVLKIFMWFVIAVIVIIGSYVGYIYFSESEQKDPFSIIPDDAVYILETRNLNEGWSAISKSKIWTHLMSNPYFSDINESATEFDELMTSNKIVGSLLKNRELLVSAHMISGVDYDFIFVVDVEKASKVSFLTDIFGLFDYTVRKRDYNGVEISELIDNASNETLYVVIIGNLLAGSYSGSLIEKLIDQKDVNYWKENPAFVEASKEVSSRQLFRFYFNYAMLDKYMKCYLSEESEQMAALSQALGFSVFNVDFENEQLSFNGYTNFFDSIPSYINALADVKPGSFHAYNILSNKTALYLSLGFNDFDSFYNNLTLQFANEDSSEYDNINKNIERAEKFLKIDLHEVFFSWIGNEIAFVKMQPESNAREEDVVILFHTKSIDDAKTGMEKLNKQVKKRSPVKFEVIDYKNFEINYLNMKGFFKLFLGKMFGKLEKPYFTYIEDFVVFSNSPSSLMEFIDDYIKGDVLANNDAFMDFKNEFSGKANVTIFIQMPKVYSHMFFYSDKDTRQSVQENRELILSFARVGFQLISDDRMFQTKIVAIHDESALMYEELEKMENAADDLFMEELDSLCFKPILTEEQLKTEGLVQIYYPDTLELKKDSVIMAEGVVNDGVIDGLWRNFYESGNIKSAIVYRDGHADGNAMFYYDNDASTSRMEVNFVEDVINGEYKEYYENGSLKANLFYRDGKLHGTADFYYKSGKLKISGQYKDGVKKGKWKYFTETGELIDKENWKKHKDVLTEEEE